MIILIRRRSVWSRMVRFPGLWLRHMRLMGGHPLIAFRLAWIVFL